MSSIDDDLKIELDSIQKELLLTNLDEEGKLSCLKAFKVSKLIRCEPKEMSAITKSLGIKITNCELGVFGKLEFQDPNIEVYNRLKQNYMGDKTLECKVLWDEAKKSTLKIVGSTVKNSDIEVIHCQLGCFREKKGHKDGNKS
ncbi:ModE family transcriptional regulator [Aliarcobacter butzleri]|uniref:ModE family transcriptional regulator n=1 Tax=Aliarcobacter butzleri TaxID=28197 RepID=UPI0021B382A9|nr:ModE family transcriptional regulator [Aliarcobacter butzleri]MCT7574989.1 ModE family transcriptional regulator [Aliarcobacter butzleri]MCT7576621.1 ModE family transcriptional regulator [Aliarcobacter butzleri]